MTKPEDVGRKKKGKGSDDAQRDELVKATQHTRNGRAEICEEAQRGGGAETDAGKEKR